MSLVARFESKADGFSARVDDRTGLWVVTPSTITPNQAIFVASELNSFAPPNGDYRFEVSRHWFGDYAMVNTPAHWYSAMRVNRRYPDGDVVVDIIDDEGPPTDPSMVY